MSSAGSTVPGNGSRSWRFKGVWVAPVALLVGLWLWLAFSSGGYIARHWLVPSLALGLFGLVVSLLAAYPRRPRQLSLALLGLFACYSVWVAVSALWADSTSRVWMESARTFSYLLLFGLALIYFTDPAARRAFRYLLMAAAFVLLLTCVWRLWSTNSVAGLFIENRFSYPVTYPNNAGALFLVAFWPLMWLASGTEEHAPIRGVALGLATGLLGLAVMTQSRGAIWSLAITVVLMFIVSPARLRLLFYLLAPALLLVYEFPTLNRYWLEGPEAVGGGPGARTLAVASITAAFIGVILALLERWVKVSRRMKAIFGTIVLLGALGGVIYGSITLTSDVGGPFKWLSQTWRQFTGQIEPNESPDGASRFTLLSSTGRVDIWQVAWKGFESNPVLGVGADNFIFQYDRLRTTERSSKPQQAHSLELQILGETGLMGGIFAFGGILLALGGLLWPRCTAGWRGIRGTWLRRERRPDERGSKSLLNSAGTPGSTVVSNTVGASERWCNPRWGDEPRAYGWEMALLMGTTYWFIHASVDWLWQMAGVSIPALLFIVAGAASVDARAGELWPRVGRWLRIGAPSISRNEPQQVDLAIETRVQNAEESETSITGQPLPEAKFFQVGRRADQHNGRIRRRKRRAERREQSTERLRPPGLLSHVFRACMVALSLLVLIVAGLPYLSLLYQESARALADTDPMRAVERAGAARWLLPADPAPYSTQAFIYADAALRTTTVDSPDRSGAVLDNIALAIASHEEAIALEPVNWALHYNAGLASVDLLLATGYAEGWLSNFEFKDVPSSIGLMDWSPLAVVHEEIADPGQATDSLARDDTARGKVAVYRNLSPSELAELARRFLNDAKERNPLAPQIEAALETIDKIETEVH